MISNPVGDDQRFNLLNKGDLAVIEFMGEGYPRSIRMVLISANYDCGKSIHGSLVMLVKSMNLVSVDQLRFALKDIQIDDDHSINHLLVDDILEDAALGVAQAAELLFKRRQARRISRSEIAQVRRLASEISYNPKSGDGSAGFVGHLSPPQRDATGKARLFSSPAG
jgi:hypothetical protein